MASSAPSPPQIPISLALVPPASLPQTALVLASAGPAPPGFLVVRHADAAAIAQAGACSCCRRPSGLTTVLRQLFLDRVRGQVSFERVIVVADRALLDEALRDPLVAARYTMGAPAPSA